jgi:hypothetical protein
MLPELVCSAVALPVPDEVGHPSMVSPAPLNSELAV